MNLLVMRATYRAVLLLSRSSNLTCNLTSAQARRTFSKSQSCLSATNNPGGPDTEAAFRASEDLLKERYNLRADEDIEKKRSRLLYQSRKRGMLENGVILASFADKFLHKFNPEQLDQYDRLINLPTNDWDIYYWATKTKPTPVEYETPVMQQLREHLKSKVSNEQKNCDSTKNVSGRYSDIYKKNPEEIAMPAAKRKYELNIDPSSVSLTNYEEELYNNRVRVFRNKDSMVEMTDWRKNYFLKRIRRSISSPVSLGNMSDQKPTEIFTQKPKRRSIARAKTMQTDLIDSPYEKSMKHHNFVQYLLASNFTNDPRDYDDEAEAWAEMMWHRDYGSADINLAPSHIRCTSCSAELHCCDQGIEGYIPKEIFVELKTTVDDVKCQRCKFSKLYNIPLGRDVSERTFLNLLSDLKNKEPSVVCLLVDLTSYPSSIWENLVNYIGIHHKILVAGNKLDLLPYDGFEMLNQVKLSLKKSLSKLRPSESNLYIQDVVVLSTRTGFGVEGLVSRLLLMSGEDRRDIYLVGSSESGKSTLFNALLQSDLSAIRKADLISRLSSFRFPSESVNMLKFPLAKLEGWELELKKRKMERSERNTSDQIRSLGSTTENRQATMPHLSMLIDRINYPPLISNSTTDNCSAISLETRLEDSTILPRFSEDHPFQTITHLDPFSASSEKFITHGHLHMIPSAIYHDQLHDLLTPQERFEVFPHETIVPRKYSLRPLESIFIAGLARLDLLTSQSTVIFIIFASKYLPIHVVPSRKADQFYRKFLGTPYLGIPAGSSRKRLENWPGLAQGKEDVYVRGETVESGKDIVLSSFGWALVRPGIDQECIVRAYTPAGRGISTRDVPLLLCSKGLKGRKIRDTPLFEHPHYKIESLKNKI